MKDVVQMTWRLREKQPIILVLFIAFRLQTRESSKGDIWAKNNIFWCLVFVYFSCTCSLEVNASHLHGVCRVVWCDVCVVQQTLGAWLWLFSFATADEDKHRVERRKDVPEEGKKTTTELCSVSGQTDISTSLTDPQLHGLRQPEWNHA